MTKIAKNIFTNVIRYFSKVRKKFLGSGRLQTEMRSSVVVSLFESDLLEAAINDLVQCCHAGITDRHSAAEPVEHCAAIQHKPHAIDVKKTFKNVNNVKNVTKMKICKR